MSSCSTPRSLLMCHAPRGSSANAETASRTTTSGKSLFMIGPLLGAVLRQVADEVGVHTCRGHPGELADRQVGVPRFGQRFDELRADAHGPQRRQVLRRKVPVA